MKLFRDLFLPVFVAKHEKEKDVFSIQGPNQVRSYTVSALKYLAAWREVTAQSLAQPRLLRILSGAGQTIF